MPRMFFFNTGPPKKWPLPVNNRELQKRNVSSRHLSISLSSLTQPVICACMILIISLSLTSAQELAFLNSTSLITITNTTWDLNSTKEITFRTCYDSGILISMNASFTSQSSTSLSSSVSQKLAVILEKSSLMFVWNINGENGSTNICRNISKNNWYTVTLKKSLNSQRISVVQGSNLTIASIIVANETYNSFLFDKRIIGNLNIGEGFYGCLYPGPGINFTVLGLNNINVDWDHCPLEEHECPNAGQTTDYCYTFPCKNGAICKNGDHNYTCSCPHNFNGTNCENDLAALYGCDIKPCMNQGTCRNQSEISPHKFICSCPPGFTGSLCESSIDLCRTSPCKHGVCVNSTNSYSCNCDGTGFTGPNCSKDINECSNSTPCGPYPCFNRPGGFSCDCPAGYEGPACQELNECISSPCKNGGICIDQVNNFTCNCSSGYTGPTCDIDINDCKNNPCLGSPNTKCQDLVNGYKCVCLSGFSNNTDNSCTDINECLLNVCQNHVSCENTNGSYNCNCLLGFTDKNCSTNVCNPNPCLNNGSCVGVATNYSCNCSLGFAGRNCENRDTCFNHECQNYVTCLPQVNDYKCVCLPGWTGNECQSIINYCDPNPCQFGSKCNNYVNFYNCTCSPGYEGKNCLHEIDQCIPSPYGPCKHNSTCQNVFNESPYCKCSSGYKGPICDEEINECLTEPCKNGGSCTDRLADYTCVCPAPIAGRNNYGGKNCTTYLQGCDGSNKCRYGSCIPSLDQNVHSFVCICQPGYSGALCSESTDVSFRHNKNDYIKGQINITQLNVGLRFQTTISSGVLLVWKLSETAFVFVELTDGRVSLTYKTIYSFRTYVLPTLSVVNNSVYHQLNLTITNNITLTMPLDYCSDTNYGSGKCQISWFFPEQPIPPVSQVYIGSASDLRGKTFPESYVGCMEDIVINGDLYYPGKQIGQYVGVIPGCSREIQCEVNSCSQHGFCVDKWDSFECLCYRPYHGDYCENEYQSATFGLNQDSVATYRSLPGGIDDWLISFFLITRQEEGFIVYLGGDDSNRTSKTYYAGLYIKSGRLAGDFFKCGYTKPIETTKQISDGQKYLISYDIKPTMFKVMVGSEVVFQDANVTASSKMCVPGFGFLVSIIQFGQGKITNVPRKKREADLWNIDNEIIEISSISHHRWRRQANSPILTGYQNLPGFQGIIQNVQINDILLSFNDSTFMTPDNPIVTIGAYSTKNACNESQCEHGGNCTDVFYNDFNCSCVPGFIGKNCSILNHCHFATCPSDSSCQNLQDGYECNSTASFNSDNSIITYSLIGDTPEPVLTFEFRTRGLFGLIFLLRKGDYYFKVRVTNGRLEINYKLTSGFSVTSITRQKKLVNNGLWYQAKFEIINGTSLKLQILKENTFFDNTDIVKLDVANFSFEDMLKNGEIILGSIDRMKTSIQWEAGYKGCLRQVRIGNLLLPFFPDVIFKNNTAKNKFNALRVESIVYNCEGIDACRGSSCLNGGKCVDLWNDFKCQCPVGLEGSFCEHNPNDCAGQMCYNGGVCVEGLGTFSCVCPKGFSGERCEVDVDLCTANNTALCAANNSTCIDLGYDFRCNCSSPELTGWYCNVSVNQSCSPSLCQNNGICQNTTITIGSNNVSSFNCACAGYEGPLCEKPIDYCKNGTVCENGGQCTSYPGNQSFTCHCNTSRDFSGANCSVWINNCSDNPCTNGECVDGIRNFTCKCNQSFTGAKCETKITDVCLRTSPCQHGQCVDGNCNCTGSGWKSQACDVEVNECNNTEPICLHGGSCNNTEGSFNCSCDKGYEGFQCQTPNCTAGLCGVGTCQKNFTDWWCSCPEYVEGNECEKIGPCYETPCANNGKCTQYMEFKNFTCNCTEGWEGANCTQDIDECSIKTHKCIHGNCSNTIGSYNCNCTEGYTGVYCDTDIDDCEPKPCEHNGRCVDQVNGYLCDCDLTGYNGTNCSNDIDECATNKTICNEEECINLPGSFKCNCTDKYLGDYCQSKNPCYNNTMCGSSGSCQHNLTQAGHFEPSCLCSPGYEGVNCEKKQGQSGNKGPDIGVIIGPIVGGVVLIILIIVIIAFIMTARSKRATRGAYSPSQQETSGSRVEMGNVLKKPPEERLI